MAKILGITVDMVDYGEQRRYPRRILGKIHRIIATKQETTYLILGKRFLKILVRPFFR